MHSLSVTDEALGFPSEDYRNKIGNGNKKAVWTIAPVCQTLSATDHHISGS